MCARARWGPEVIKVCVQGPGGGGGVNFLRVVGFIIFFANCSKKYMETHNEDEDNFFPEGEECVRGS